MTRYFVEYQDGDDWLCNHLETPTPTSISAAADLLGYVKGEFNLSDGYRVTHGDHDVTHVVESYIADREAEAEQHASEDEAHERSERLSWGQV